MLNFCYKSVATVEVSLLQCVKPSLPEEANSHEAISNLDHQGAFSVSVQRKHLTLHKRHTSSGLTVNTQKGQSVCFSGCVNSVLYICAYLFIYVYAIYGFKIYGLYPATDLLLEELALNSAGSKPARVSSDTADGEVKTKLQN